jgi:capsular exopolysaccharide synthesis family protein
MSSSNDHVPYGNGLPMTNGSNGNGNSMPFGQPAAGSARPLGMSPEIARLQRAVAESEEKRRFSASDYIRLLWKGKWIIAACVAVAGLLTAYYTYSLPFIYEASLDIAVNESDDQQVFGQPVWYRNRDRAMKNELQFMTSRPVFDQAALALIKRRYLDTTDSRVGDSVIPLLRAAEIALQPRLHGATEKRRIEKLVDHLSGSIERMITISPSKDADVIRVATRSGDPYEAALITNVYADIYKAHSRETNQEKVRSIERFLSGRLDTTHQLLQGTEQALKSYMGSNNIVDDEVNGSSLLESEASMKDALTQVAVEMNAVQQRLTENEAQLKNIEPTFSEHVSRALPEVITNLTHRLAKEETALSKLIAENPKAGSEVWKQGVLAQRQKLVDDLRAELNRRVDEYKSSPIGSMPGSGDLQTNGPTGPLAALKGRIFEDRVMLNTLRARHGAIQSALGQIRSEMSRVPEKSIGLGQLKREQESYEDIFKELQTTYTKKMIDKQSIMSNVRVISEAPVDTNPISPNRRANLVLGTILGLGLGIGIVLLIAYADTTVHSPDELVEKGFNVLAAIPAIETVTRRSVRAVDDTRANGVLSPHLISASDPDSPITESYRSLRTAIQFASIVEPIRMLLVTSSVPQEGKSTTSANLAIVLANSGMRTLLIDCDLRRPIAHANFGLAKEPGLVNALIGEMPVEQAIRPSGIKNLDILSSGSIPPNPSELLGSKRMSDLLDALRDQYDLVLIDSPPVGVVTDGVILSTKVDATVAVVRAHKTRMEFLERTNDEIGRVGSPLLGVVLNEFDASQSYGSSYKYYRYYKYYGYYGQQDGRERKRRRTKVARDRETATN